MEREQTGFYNVSCSWKGVIFVSAIMILKIIADNQVSEGSKEDTWHWSRDYHCSDAFSQQELGKL